EKLFNPSVVVLHGRLHAFISAANQRAMNDAIGVVAAFEMGWKSACDNADLLRGLRHPGNQFVPVFQSPPAHLVDDRDEQILLGGEVAIKDGLGYAGALRDGGSGSGIVTALSEKLGCDVDKLLTTLRCPEPTQYACLYHVWQRFANAVERSALGRCRSVPYN